MNPHGIQQVLLKLQGAIQITDASMAKLIRRKKKLKQEFNPVKLARKNFNNWIKGSEGKAFKRYLYRHQKKRCAAPDCEMQKTKFPLGHLQVDHIKPLSVYPELALDRKNLQLLCGPCNQKKGTTHSAS